MITTHALRFDAYANAPTAEAAALAFVRAHDDAPTHRVEAWAASDNPTIALRANALLAARAAMEREGLR